MQQENIWEYEFDIDSFISQHSKLGWCDIVIKPTGKILYAVPNHLYVMTRINSEVLKLNTESAYEKYRNVLSDRDIIRIDTCIIQRMASENRCILMKYNDIFLPPYVNAIQQDVMFRLKQSRLISQNLKLVQN